MAPNLAWAVVVSFAGRRPALQRAGRRRAAGEDRVVGRQSIVARERRIASALPTTFAAVGGRLCDGVGLCEGNLRDAAAGARMLRGMRPLTAG